MRFLSVQRGFTYLAVLLIVASLAYTLGITELDAHTQTQRELEKEWLFVGEAYRKAIQSYYGNSQDGVKTLPVNIAQLLEDTRFLPPMHHLRAAYADPITNAPWMLITNAEGGIIGVASSSDRQIILEMAVAKLATSSGEVPRIHSAVLFQIRQESNTEQASSDRQPSAERAVDDAD